MVTIVVAEEDRRGESGRRGRGSFGDRKTMVDHPLSAFSAVLPPLYLSAATGWTWWTTVSEIKTLTKSRFKSNYDLSGFLQGWERCIPKAFKSFLYDHLFESLCFNSACKYLEVRRGRHCGESIAFSPREIPPRDSKSKSRPPKRRKGAAGEQRRR